MAKRHSAGTPVPQGVDRTEFSKLPELVQQAISDNTGKDAFALEDAVKDALQYVPEEERQDVIKCVLRTLSPE